MPVGAKTSRRTVTGLLPWLFVACSGGGGVEALEIHGPALDPDAAPRAAVDRYAEARAADPELPQADTPIDFDADFYREGFGPDGGAVGYYDFGTSSSRTMPAYRLRDPQGNAIPEQRAILTALPGQSAYSDFWRWVEVEVPSGYVANSITSAAELAEADYPLSPTVEVSNRPVVPAGSTARLAEANGELEQAWFDDQVVFAFTFAEAQVRVRGDAVDYAAIYVCLTEGGSFCVDGLGRTHNVIAAAPGSEGYSPLWRPHVFPEAAFESVLDLDSVLAAEPQEQSVLVNCPVVVW